MKGNGNGAVLTEATPQLLARALQLPPGTTITGAQWDNIRHILTLRIEGPDIAPVIEGATPPKVPFKPRHWGK